MDLQLKLRTASCWRLLLGLTLIFECLSANVAQADGLIFDLPLDGTWCEFSGESKTTLHIELPKEMADQLTAEAKKQFEKMSEPQRSKETVRISSVGRTERAQRPCRWLEIKRSGEPIASDDKQLLADSVDGAAVLKILVPERYLVRGEDALLHAVLTFWNPKEIDVKKIAIERGFNRIQYELDRFRPIFSPPLKDEERLADQTIQTPVGEFRNCEVITGTSHFDQPTLGDSRWEFEQQWELALHADAPFGLVRIACTAKGKEVARSHVTRIESRFVHTLTKAGDEAVSELSMETAKE